MWMLGDQVYMARVLPTVAGESLLLLFPLSKSLFT